MSAPRERRPSPQVVVMAAHPDNDASVAGVGLAAAFRQGYSAEATVPAAFPAAFDIVDLERRLSELGGQGRTTYSALGVDETAFARHLGRCSARAGVTTIDALLSLAIPDLYLTCACVLRVTGAAAEFDIRCADRMRAVIARAIKSEELRKEVEQRARDVLLVGGADVPAKVGEYRGQAPLDRWAAVVAHGLAINLLRAEDAEQRARQGAANEILMTAVEPELLYAKHQYRAEFERALVDSMAALGARDRTILLLQVVRNVSVGSIGKMYGVSQSTASRWLAQAREAILAEVQRLLKERLNIPTDEIESLAGLVASQMDLSMSRLLDGTRARRSDKK